MTTPKTPMIRGSIDGGARRQMELRSVYGRDAARWAFQRERDLRATRWIKHHQDSRPKSLVEVWDA